MNNNEKMVEAIKDIGLYYKKSIDDLADPQTAEKGITALLEQITGDDSDNRKKYLSELIKKVTEQAQQLGNMIIKIDAIYLDSVNTSNCLDSQPLLHYIAMRAKLSDSVEGVGSTLNGLMQASQLEDMSGMTEAVGKLIGAGIESVKRHSTEEN
tara:strand:+ start:52815 stop:53276 length:462 start_codon:yes stop_codon:yes gene_type:complete